jgi:Ca2+-binding EF-hand superfamily protein
MKTKMKIMLTLLALGASTAIVSAQDTNSAPGAHGPRGPGMNGHRPPVPAIVAALDANGDGMIDASEIANASTALLKLDQNGDGKLSADELKPQMPAGGNGQQFTPPDGDKFPTLLIMKALDTNGDGELDASEIANASTALKTLDTNGDGQLIREEIMPKFHGGFGGPGGTPPDDQ